MFARHGVIPPTRFSMIERCVSSIIFGLVLAATAIPAHAQGNFNSGSTGADGAFNPPHNFTLQIPESGVLNFTTITINGDLRFSPNSRNTPVTLLATGDVIIKGRIFINGNNAFNTRFGGFAVPGGFRGGDGGQRFDNFNGTAGDGPGGGIGGRGSADSSSRGGGGGFLSGGNNGCCTNPGQGGPSYGTRNLLPLIGGSGGGGNGGSNDGIGGAAGAAAELFSLQAPAISHSQAVEQRVIMLPIFSHKAVLAMEEEALVGLSGS